jgi:hypothetical protein
MATKAIESAAGDDFDNEDVVKGVWGKKYGSESCPSPP